MIGLQGNFTQLITGLSGLITFLDNAVEGQPCIVYGDTLENDPVAQVETSSIDTLYILQVFRNHIKMRRDGSPPPDKDVLMNELTLTGVPLEDVDAVYKQISDMLTDYAKLTKENPVLRDLVVLFSQIALYLQQLGDIRLELERLQRQIDKCTDMKEKKSLQEQLASKDKEFREARAELGTLQQKHDEEREELKTRIKALTEEQQRNLQRIDALKDALAKCDSVSGEAAAEVARLTPLIDHLEKQLAAAREGRDVALARIPELEAALKALEAEKDAEIGILRGELADLEAEKDAAIDALTREKDAAMDALRGEKDAAMDALRGEKDAAIDALRREKDAAMDALRAEKDAEIRILRGQIAALEADKTAQLDALRGELAALEEKNRIDAEMIAELVLARKLETTGHEIIKAVHPHPTMSEAVMEAAAAAYGEVIHL
jgi:chromosome segregation ATPase